MAVDLGTPRFYDTPTSQVSTSTAASDIASVGKLLGSALEIDKGYQTQSLQNKLTVEADALNKALSSDPNAIPDAFKDSPYADKGFSEQYQNALRMYGDQFSRLKQATDRGAVGRNVAMTRIDQLLKNAINDRPSLAPELRKMAADVIGFDPTGYLTQQLFKESKVHDPVKEAQQKYEEQKELYRLNGGYESGPEFDRLYTNVQLTQQKQQNVGAAASIVTGTNTISENSPELQTFLTTQMDHIGAQVNVATLSTIAKITSIPDPVERAKFAVANGDNLLSNLTGQLDAAKEAYRKQLVDFSQKPGNALSTQFIDKKVEEFGKLAQGYTELAKNSLDISRNQNAAKEAFDLAKTQSFFSWVSQYVPKNMQGVALAASNAVFAQFAQSPTGATVLSNWGGEIQKQMDSHTFGTIGPVQARPSIPLKPMAVPGSVNVSHAPETTNPANAMTELAKFCTTEDHPINFKDKAGVNDFLNAMTGALSLAGKNGNSGVTGQSDSTCTPTNFVNVANKGLTKIAGVESFSQPTKEFYKGFSGLGVDGKGFTVASSKLQNTDRAFAILASNLKKDGDITKGLLADSSMYTQEGYSGLTTASNQMLNYNRLASYALLKTPVSTQPNDSVSKYITINTNSINNIPVASININAIKTAFDKLGYTSQATARVQAAVSQFNARSQAAYNAHVVKNGLLGTDEAFDMLDVIREAMK